MKEKMNSLIEELQKNGVLPSGDYFCEFLEQPASYVWKVILGAGFFIKQIKVRHGMEEDKQADVIEQFHRECKFLLSLKAYFSTSKFFSIPEIVYINQKELIIVTKALNGKSLQIICNQYAQRFGSVQNGAAHACFNVGRFLKFLHDAQKENYALDDLEKLVCYIRDRISGAIFSVSELKRIDAFLLAREKEISYKLGGIYKSYVHHDLNPTNVLVDGDKINVLDFADAAMESPYQDLVYFPLMINGQFGNFFKYRPSVKNELLSRFYDGYGCQLDHLKEDPLYLLYVLKNLSIFLNTFSSLKNHWGALALSKLKNRLVLEYDLKNTKTVFLSRIS